MNVLGKMKKVSVGGMFIGAMVLVTSLSFTGCLTKEEEKDPDPVDNSKALTTEKMDTIWNVKGPNKGAYNLVSGVAVSEGDANANKDAVDMGVLAGGVVTWPKTLNSLNGTMFVTAASSFTYATATDSTLIKAYAAGTAAATTKVLAAGDVILAKLRGGNTYAAIKIIAVTETPSDNKDYIHFGYRLTP